MHKKCVLPVLHSKNGHAWIFSDNGSLDDRCRAGISHYIELHVNTSIIDGAIGYQKLDSIDWVNWINLEIICFSNDTHSIVSECSGKSLVRHNLEDELKVT